MQDQQEKTLTRRGAIIAAALVLLWTLGGCFIAVSYQVATQQLLMIIGFGAILTIFLLQFPILFLAGALVVYVGMWALLFSSADPRDMDRYRFGLLTSLPVVLTMAGMAWSLIRLPLKRSELVIIYACVVIAIPWCITMKSVIESSTANLFEQQQRSEPQTYQWAHQMPWWGPTVKEEGERGRGGDGEKRQEATTASVSSSVSASPPLRVTVSPSQEAVRGFVRGNGGRVPWGLWWRPTLYWAGMCLAYEAMIMGLLLMFRKRWIEHERLPFVWAYPAIQIIRDAETRRHGDAEKRQAATTAPVTSSSLSASPCLPLSPSSSWRRWLPFAIGLGICLPGILLLGPMGEPLSGLTILPWAGQEGITGGYDLTRLNILPGVPVKVFWGPLVLTVLLMFPVDCLMTVALTYILTSLLMPWILAAMGIGVGPVRMQEFVKWGLRFGGCAGLLIWSAWFNRKTMWDYVRSLWGGRRATAEADDELSRPLIAAMMVAGTIGFVLLGCYATSLVQMLFLTGFVLIYAFAQVRQRVEGMPMTYDNNIASHQMVALERTVLSDHYTLAGEGAAVTPNSWTAHWFQWGFSGQLKSLGPHNMLLEAFKVAHEFKVHARTIAKAVGLTMLVVAIVVPVLYLQLMYTYGFENSYQGELSTWSSFTQWSERAAAYGIHSTSAGFFGRNAGGSLYDQYHNVFYAGLGVIIIGALFYLRREFPRFPISPVGVVIGAELFGGAGVPFSADMVWFSFLAAWIAKSLIFRWLGVRSFREKVQPALILLLCGMIYGLMLYLFRQITLGWGALR